MLTLIKITSRYLHNNSTMRNRKIALCKMTLRNISPQQIPPRLGLRLG